MQPDNEIGLVNRTQNETFFWKNKAQDMVEKLVLDLFLKN